MVSEILCREPLRANRRRASQALQNRSGEAYLSIQVVKMVVMD